MKFHRSLQESCVLSLLDGLYRHINSHSQMLIDSQMPSNAGQWTLTASGTQEPSWPVVAVAEEGRDS